MSKASARYGFTLVELIMVIVIIGLLAAVVTPKFTTMRSEAQSAAEQGVVAAVRSGVKLAHLTNITQGDNNYPSSLDSADTGEASEDNPLFTEVIEGGLTDSHWEKTAATTYEYNPTGNTYAYSSADGTFTLQSD